jgi:hypothetical protein
MPQATLPSPPLGVTLRRHLGESFPAWLGRLLTTFWLGLVPCPEPSTLDLGALREAKLAEASSAAPGPFFEFGDSGPILASDDVVGALLAHIECAYRNATIASHPKPARQWWDELARLASGVRQ